MTDLTINGETVAVAVTGDPTRPALVLSHALGTDHRMWDGQVALLEKHFRLVRYDTRGHGGSEIGSGPLSIAQLGRDALNILDAIEIKRAHWLGLSMGGAVGLWILANAPERIDRAIIANSAPRFGTPDGWNERILTARTHGMSTIAEATLARWFGASFAAREPQRLAAIGAMLRAMEPQSYAAICAALRDTDLHAAIGTIRNDVLVISGRDDPTITPDDANALATTLPGGRLVSLDARHMSNVEAEADFNAAVVAFLTTKRMPRAKPSAATGLKKRGIAKSLVPERGRAQRRSNAARNPLKQPALAKPSAAKAGAAKGKVGAGKTASGKAARRASVTTSQRPRKTARAKPLTTKTKTKPAAAKRHAGKSAPVRRSTIKSTVGRMAVKAPARKSAAKVASKISNKVAPKTGGKSARATKATTRRKTSAATARGVVKAATRKATPAKAKAVAKRAAPVKTTAKKSAPAARRTSIKKPRRPNGRRKP